MPCSCHALAMSHRATPRHACTMLCHGPCHTVPHHAVPHHAVPHYATLRSHHASPWHAMTHQAVPHHAMPRHATSCHTTLHHVMPRHTMPCHATPTKDGHVGPGRMGMLGQLGWACWDCRLVERTGKCQSLGCGMNASGVTILPRAGCAAVEERHDKGNAHPGLVRHDPCLMPHAS